MNVNGLANYLVYETSGDYLAFYDNKIFSDSKDLGKFSPGQHEGSLDLISPEGVYLGSYWGLDEEKKVLLANFATYESMREHTGFDGTLFLTSDSITDVEDRLDFILEHKLDLGTDAGQVAYKLRF